MGGVLWRPEWSGLKKLLVARAMAGAGGVLCLLTGVAGLPEMEE